MYKGSTGGLPSRGRLTPQTLVRPEQQKTENGRDQIRGGEGGGEDGESPTEPNYRQNPHVYEERIIQLI